MNASAQSAAFLLLAFSPSAWSQSAPAPATQPSISEVVTGFTNYHQITTSIVFVNPELAMLCPGESTEEVEAARLKFGPDAPTGIQVYMNKLATDAFTTNTGAFPVGAVVVKKKTIHGDADGDGKRPRQTDLGVVGMVKRPLGYDPKNGDWEYFFYENAAKIASGRISTCVRCHSAAKDKDYVFGTWRRTGG